MTISDHRTIECVASCTLILLFKFYLTSIIQKTQRVLAPEDRAIGHKDRNPNSAVVGPPAANTNPSSVVTVPNSTAYTLPFDNMARWQRIVINDLENIPITIFLMWISYSISKDNMVTFVITIVFTACRYLHSLCYILRLQPLRSIFWFLGFLCTWTLMGNIMYAAVHYNPPFARRTRP